MADARKAYAALMEHVRNVWRLDTCRSLLAWDQETYMPAAGAAHRAEQLALLAGLVHEQATATEIGERLAACEDSDLVTDARSVEAVNIREIRRDFDRKIRLPRRLVEELARTTSLAHVAWVEARAASAFETFRPWLEKVVALAREMAEAYGYSDVPYDALIEDYEPGETTARLTTLFDELRASLVPLIERIIGAPRQPDPSVLTGQFPLDRQRVFSEMVAAFCGYDFAAGRLDTVVHPFSTRIGPGDVRITTRFDETSFPEFGVLHEAGHGMYSQGLDPDHAGTPMGDSVSLGIHESQSRMWENYVGRSRGFWRFFLPKARAIFPQALPSVSLDAFCHAINTVRPSWIRVEADEATYNLHIVLRFELEQALIRGDLEAAGVPGAWNERTRALLGIEVPDDRRGCLQDTHWSMGSFGYFPTYCLGNLYAAQFFAQAQADLGDLDAAFARGEFRPLLEWLREKIHRQGRRFKAGALAEAVTGRPLGVKALVDSLRAKYEPLYGL